MAYIKESVVEQIWETADILHVIKDFITLNKQGANYIGLSPFKEESTPSFTVSPAKGIWKCFATGQGGSSAVSFLMAAQKKSYPDALEYLASKYSITLEYDNSEYAKEQNKIHERRLELQPLLESTIRKFEEAFKNLPKNHPAKIEVYGKRQYTEKIVEDYRIGFAPGGTFIYDLCAPLGRVEDAKELGLIKEYSSYTADFWKERVVYPLIENKGTSYSPVGLAGRDLSETGKYAKWLNSPESSLYKKETFWFGLDKAKKTIVETSEAWLVEGYNDVIAWQTHGILNTIASCGTSVALKQMKVLRKLCDKVILCFDPDSAGKKAMLKYIPQLLKLGFRVQLLLLNQDPDDSVRLWKNWIGKKPDLTEMSQERDYREEGFSWLMEHRFKGKDAIETVSEAKKLAIIIKSIDDESMRTIYAGMLQQKSKVSKTQINSWLKPTTKQNKETASLTFGEIQPDEFYRLPKNLGIKLEEVESTIKKYQMFMAKNQIWVQTGSQPPYNFQSVSNFSIEVIQHMNDDKEASKLIRVKNIENVSAVFDIPSSRLNKPESFESEITDRGNYQWRGGRAEHQKLKWYLMDKMGVGRKIDVLGWQAEGFWVWNNKVTLPGDDPIEIDQNGVFEHKGTSYYVPSANEIFKNSPFHYEPQKKIMCYPPPISFSNYASQVVKVHREHGMMGLLFTVSSMFQDIIVDQIDGFPLLFLYGQASSGKDQLADVCQSFFGKPQTPINLEGGASTLKAKVREFAQFSNLISQLSEYKNGDPQTDGILKGLWDRNGYKRGNINSHVGTESIPILSSPLITGNYPADQEALITRMIWNFMDKTTFTDAETKEYEKLSDMTKKGISGFTELFLHHREMVKNNFKPTFREFKAVITERNKDANSRMITNLAVLGTFYKMFKDIPNIDFTFSHQDMMSHFDKTLKRQMGLMSNASIITKWWNCFLASMRGNHMERLEHGHDFKLDGNLLYFNFTSCYIRIQRQWFSQYRGESAPPQTNTMTERLKDEASFVRYKDKERMDKGRNARNTSVYVVDISLLYCEDEIRSAVDFQVHQNSLFDSEEEKASKSFPNSPATPNSKKMNSSQEDLPF